MIKPSPCHAQPEAPGPGGAQAGVVNAAGGDGVDVAALTRGVELMLRAMRVPEGSEVMRETPRRVAASYGELLTPAPFDGTTFANTDGYNELIVVRNIRVQSLCEHHLLPFVGVAHIGYVPDRRLVGLSKFARVVDMYGRRLQQQERMTVQIADWFDGNLAPRAVGVIVEAEHTCMAMRGPRATGTTTTTTAMRGLLRTDTAIRAEFFRTARDARPA